MAYPCSRLLGTCRDPALGRHVRRACRRHVLSDFTPYEPIVFAQFVGLCSSLKWLRLSRLKLAGPPTPRDTEVSNAYATLHDSLGPVCICSLIGINSTEDPGIQSERNQWLGGRVGLCGGLCRRSCPAGESRWGPTRPPGTRHSSRKYARNGVMDMPFFLDSSACATHTAARFDAPGATPPPMPEPPLTEAPARAGGSRGTWTLCL